MHGPLHAAKVILRDRRHSGLAGLEDARAQFRPGRLDHNVELSDKDGRTLILSPSLGLSLTIRNCRVLFCVVLWRSILDASHCFGLYSVVCIAL